MARKFVAASSQYLSGTPAVTGPPMTMSAWVNFTTITTEQCVITLNHSGGVLDYFTLEVRGDLSGQVRAQCYDLSNNPIGDTTANITTSGWHHIAATFSSSGGTITATAYLDGGHKGSGSATCNPTGITILEVGAFAYTTQINFVNGIIAEPTMWGVVLSDAEIAALATGVPSYKVRPQTKGYWPLWGLSSPEPDLSGSGNNLTLNAGPTQANHAPITLWTPKRPSFGSPPPAVLPPFGWFSPLPALVPKPAPFTGAEPVMTMQVPPAAVTTVAFFDAAFPTIIRRDKSVS